MCCQTTAQKAAVVNVVASQKCIMFEATILPGPCFPTHIYLSRLNKIVPFLKLKSDPHVQLLSLLTSFLFTKPRSMYQKGKERKRICVTLVGHYINSIYWYYMLWWFKQMSGTYQTQIDFSLVFRLMYR